MRANGSPKINLLEGLLAGGPNYRVTLDLGGAIFAPAAGSDEAEDEFQPIAERIKLDF